MKSNRTISAIVIDDEEDIRQTLRERLEEDATWNIVGESDSVSIAVQCIIRENPDVIFLDIKLREGDAFDILKELEDKKKTLPYIVLMTGYTQFEYAQKAINLYSDKLLMLLEKPFWENWESKVNEIIDKVTSKMADEEITIFDKKITLRVDNKTYFIDADEIVFLEIESKDTYTTKVCLVDHVYITNKSLAKLSKVLPDNIVQINRHSIINTDYLSSYDHNQQKLTLKGISNRDFDLGLVYRRKLFSKLDAMSG